MRNEIVTKEDIKKMAIAIQHPMQVCWPQHGDKHKTFNPAYAANPNLEHCYSYNNGTVAFIEEAILYVMPSFRKVMSILHQEGFSEKGFYVPFSNWDYPVAEKEYWENLQREAHEQHIIEFIADCNAFSDRHGFGVLDEKHMQKCFEMPISGVLVKHPYFEKKHYPEITGTCLDCVAAEKIGHYCTNNGTTVFIYRDGKTYVTKNWEVVDALQKAGYKEGAFFVPFSNGESIEDSMYAKQWEKISA